MFALLFAALALNDTVPSYEAQVRSLFVGKCIACHGPDKQRSGLRLDRRAGALGPAESGRAAVVPGAPAQSELLVRVKAKDPTDRMPPDGPALSREEIAVLERWVAAGAPWPKGDAPPSGPARALVVTDTDRAHWAFRPLRPPEPPEAGAWAQTPVDRFVLAGLEEAGLRPNPEAARRMLVRRLSFDLLGLPPAVDQVEAFVRDRRPDAYQRLVDRLLASPHFGERWGRHWLDAARYADSAGYEEDRSRPGAYHYRDFVIAAFNQDLPYDQFLRWQIAGDLDAPADRRALAATGFVTAAPDVRPDFINFRKRHRYDELDNVVSTIGTAVLGLTLGCARCHDHKSDPIPQRDYYRLMAAFTRTERREILRDTEDRTAMLVLRDGPPRPSYLLMRGDPDTEQEQVTPGVLTVLGAARPGQPRLALAAWLTDPDQGAGALVARVIVNRLWHHHFGQGLVRTTDNFGLLGERPSHPELLDWLAAELVRSGWRLKHVHRLILLSATYRMDTRWNASSAARDPEAALLWRRRPMRLEAEALRDALLASSGTLDPRIGGPPIKPPMAAEAIFRSDKKYETWPADVQEGPAGWRRSVYIFVKRNNLFPLLQTFDAPDGIASCGRRVTTTVAPQALALLNDPFVRTQAARFADRLRSQRDPIEGAFLTAFSRRPTTAERASANAFLARQRTSGRSGMALQDFAQVLFAANEFAYVD